jgi:hypothetical protein
LGVSSTPTNAVQDERGLAANPLGRHLDRIEGMLVQLMATGKVIDAIPPAVSAASNDSG